MLAITQWSAMDWCLFAVVIWFVTCAIWLMVQGLENRRMRLDKQEAGHD